MAGPKITRLNDPANPYGGKRTPTAAPTAAQQVKNKAASQAAQTRQANAALKARPAASPVVATTRAVNPLMKKANEQYMDSRKAAIDRQVDGPARKPKR